jgi:hypothetical protein
MACAARAPKGEGKGLWKIDTVTRQVWVYNLATVDVEKMQSVGGFIPVETGKP